MLTRYFQRVRWLSAAPDDPAVLWAEVVEEWEVRKIDEFADGSLVWADCERESGLTALGHVPMPPPEEIARDPQFLVELVDQATFEAVWQRARAAGTS